MNNRSDLFFYYMLYIPISILSIMTLYSILCLTTAISQFYSGVIQHKRKPSTEYYIASGECNRYFHDEIAMDERNAVAVMPNGIEATEKRAVKHISVNETPGLG